MNTPKANCAKIAIALDADRPLTSAELELVRKIAWVLHHKLSSPCDCFICADQSGASLSPADLREHASAAEADLTF